MKAATILFIAIYFAVPLVTNSQTKTRQRFYPAEYLYPIDQLGNGKTYIYQVDQSNQFRYMDEFPLIENDTTLFVTKHYDSTKTVDSAKFSSNWLMVDYYLFPGGIKVRGNIEKEEVIDDGTRLGKHISKMVLKEANVIATVSSEEVFIKDTVFEWRGKKLDCIVTDVTTVAEFKSAKDTTYKKIMNSSYRGYFGKGTGLLRYKGGIPEKTELIDLVEIKDIEIKSASHF